MKTSVLDHGYVELVETYGSDEKIIEAARMSTQKGFLGWEPDETCTHCGGARRHLSHDYFSCSPPSRSHNYVKHPGDAKLLRFMWENAHATPFEFAGAVIEVQAPIFVFREWHRHRTQSFSEASARYSPLPDVNYVPTLERIMINVGGTNRQAGTVAGAEPLTEVYAEEFQYYLVNHYAEMQKMYEWALKRGVPKELARIHLPVGRYSRMRASANLRNWLQFLTLRQAPNAQYEIRVYADALHDILAEKFPRTLALFDEKK